MGKETKPMTMFFSKIRHLTFDAERGKNMNTFHKQPDEILKITIDFTNSLVSETIASIAVSSWLGETEVTTIIHTSSTTTTQSVVTVKAGSSGNDYKITVKATTNTGNVYKEDVLMKVMDL